MLCFGTVHSVAQGWSGLVRAILNLWDLPALSLRTLRIIAQLTIPGSITAGWCDSGTWFAISPFPWLLTSSFARPFQIPRSQVIPQVAGVVQSEECIWNESLRKLGAEYKYFEWTYLRVVLLYFPVIEKPLIWINCLYSGLKKTLDKKYMVWKQRLKPWMIVDAVPRRKSLLLPPGRPYNRLFSVFISGGRYCIKCLVGCQHLT